MPGMPVPPLDWPFVEQLVETYIELGKYRYPGAYGDRVDLHRMDRHKTWQTEFGRCFDAYFQAAAAYRLAPIDRRSLVRHVLSYFTHEKYGDHFSPVFQELPRDEARQLLPEIVDRYLEEENLWLSAVENLLQALSPDEATLLLLERLEAYLRQQTHRTWGELDLEFWAVLGLPVVQANLPPYLDLLDRLLGPGSGSRWLTEWQNDSNPVSIEQQP